MKKRRAGYFQRHARDCQCSWCHEHPSVPGSKLHYGLNIPPHWKMWNSWWVIKYGPGMYIRWTNEWLLDWDFKLQDLAAWMFKTSAASVVAFVVFQILLHWWPLK